MSYDLNSAHPTPRSSGVSDSKTVISTRPETENADLQGSPRARHVVGAIPPAMTEPSHSTVNWDRVLIFGVASLIAFLVVLEIVQIAFTH